MKTLYILFSKSRKGEGMAKPFTNLKSLSEFTGINYDSLMYRFSRQKKVWIEDEVKGVIIVRTTSPLEKGKQKISNTYKLT